MAAILTRVQNIHHSLDPIEETLGVATGDFVQCLTKVGNKMKKLKAFKESDIRPMIDRVADELEQNEKQDLFRVFYTPGWVYCVQLVDELKY